VPHYHFDTDPIVGAMKEGIRQAILALPAGNDGTDLTSLTKIANAAKDLKLSGKDMLKLLHAFCQDWVLKNPNVDINSDLSAYHSVRMCLRILHEVAVQTKKTHDAINPFVFLKDGKPLYPELETILQQTTAQLAKDNVISPLSTTITVAKGLGKDQTGAKRTLEAATGDFSPASSKESPVAAKKEDSITSRESALETTRTVNTPPTYKS
jgi:hypothetical protein